MKRVPHGLTIFGVASAGSAIIYNSNKAKTQESVANELREENSSLQTK